MDTYEHNNEILSNYTAGEITPEQANTDLRGAGSDLYLDPERNIVTQDEIEETVTGETPDEACGYGLAISGAGSPNKVRVQNGLLIDNDFGIMRGEYIIGGKTYHVKGRTLVD